ncbi:MAG: heavy metal-binding domain-containing protein [Pseudomonadota bacterium]
MAQSLQFIINIGIPLATLMVAYFVGTWLERRHFNNIREREKQLAGFPVTTFERLPPDWHATDSQLLVGSVVVSLDYFKRIIAGLRALIGGRVKTYEPLLDRARREALLRLIEQASDDGFDAVINVRLETSRMANSQGGQGTAGIEMIAFGTAVKLHGLSR